MLATLLCVLCFGDAARRFARRIAPRSTVAQRAALALVLGSALLCASYGVLGQMSHRTTAEIELVFHGEPAAAPRDATTEGAGEVRVFEERVDKGLATPGHLVPFALACLASGFLLDRRRRALPMRFDALVLFAYVPLALSLSGILRSVARGYDAVWYHLPLAVAFAQNGHLEPPGRDLVCYFPGNMELLCRTLGDLLGPRGLPLVQLPFALAMGPLAGALARRIGGSARYAALLCLSCPLLVFQSQLAYADVVQLAALTAALVLLVDESDEDALLRNLGAGLCLGLGLGSKYAALPLLASGALPLVVTFARRRRTLASVAVLLAGTLVPAWFWYLRNLRLTGNPVFPIAVPVLHLRGLFLPRSFNADKELELVGSRLEWLVHPWLSTLTHETGFGAAFAVLVPLSLVPLAMIAWRRRTHLALPFSWGLLYLASWWFGTPHEVRHLLPLVVLLGAPATRLLVGESVTSRGLVEVVRVAVIACVLVVVRIQLFTPSPEEAVRATSFYDYYGIPPEVLDALPTGSRVANATGRPYDFALLGPHLTLRYTEYVGALTARTLDDLHADYVFVRGTPATVEAVRRSAETMARPLLVRYQGTVYAGAQWRFWGASEADTVVLFERGQTLDRLPGNMASPRRDR
ncbi:MAG: glycosyltransferase family 39 protein [Polyangia bacterium]